MPTDLPEFDRMAATGTPPYDLRSDEGGDVGRTGVLDQTRATGIVARGDKKKARKIGGNRSM